MKQRDFSKSDIEFGKEYRRCSWCGGC